MRRMGDHPSPREARRFQGNGCVDCHAGDGWSPLRVEYFRGTGGAVATPTPLRGCACVSRSVVALVVVKRLLLLLFRAGAGAGGSGAGGVRINRVGDGARGVTDCLSALLGEAAAVALQFPTAGEQHADDRHRADDRHDEPDRAPDEVCKRTFFMTEHVCISL